MRMPPEDPTEDMLYRAVCVAAAAGVLITEAQAHDIWQAMLDEWIASEGIEGFNR